MIDFVKDLVNRRFPEVHIEDDGDKNKYRDSGVKIYNDESFFMGNLKKKLKKSDLESRNAWRPENIFPSYFETFPIPTKEERKEGEYDYKHGYHTSCIPLEEGINVRFEFYYGSISGVGMDKGWSLKVALDYHGMLCKLYSFKISDIGSYIEEQSRPSFAIDCWEIKDFFDSLDFSKIEAIKENHFISDYSDYLILKDDSDQEKAFQPFMEGDTLWFNTPLAQDALSTSYTAGFDIDLLERVGVKKIRYESHANICDHFDLPSTLEEVEFVPLSEWSTLETFIDNFPELKPYISQDKADEVAAIEEYHKLRELQGTPLTINFEYGSLNGFVYSNELGWQRMQEHYANEDTVVLPVTEDIEIPLPKEEFFKILKLKRVNKKGKLPNITKISKGTSYFGNCVGYTTWWKEDFDKRLEPPK